MAFRIESDNPQPHTFRAHWAGLPGQYAVSANRAQVLSFPLADRATATIDLPIGVGGRAGFSVARVGGES